MSELDKLVEEIKLATDFQANKKTLNEQIATDLHIIYNGGMFKVTTGLLGFLATWPDDELFLEDIYENPIPINREEFLGKCRAHYQKVMNQWYVQHEQLKQIRKI